MDDQLNDGKANSAADQQRPIDPLRRVFIPRETRTPNGTIVFRTKVNGKQARKLRAKSRRKV